VAVHAAEQIAEEVKGVRECYVRILSRIGSPIDQPQIASAAIVLEKGAKMSNVRGEVEEILDDQLRDIRNITNLILEKRVILF
jgi:S-adenosylmethionine synthetase